MHCDFLTSPKGQITEEKLISGGCVLQCFAFFNGGASFEDAAEKFKNISEDGRFYPVRFFSDYKRARALNKTACCFTVENLDWRGNMPEINDLERAGTVMASLVWNEKNSLAFPTFTGGMKRGAGRLTAAGRRAVEELDARRIIIDISHLSDGGAEEILRGRKIPVVASHSCADSAFRHPRNLTDGLIAGIAGCGGVVGVNFCPKFLGAGDAVERAVAHTLQIIRAGGEDVAAIGGDFDGITPAADFPDCTHTQRFLYALEKKVGARTAEKVALGNFLRVLGEVRP